MYNMYVGIFIQIGFKVYVAKNETPCDHVFSVKQEYLMTEHELV